MKPGINHTLFILYVSNQQKAKEFYEQVLNAPPTLHVPGMTEFTLSTSCKLGLMPEEGIARLLGNSTPHPSPGNGLPRCEVYLMVDDVSTAYNKALAIGARPVNPPSQRDWGHFAAYVTDDDGHIIAFAKETEITHEKTQF